MQPLSRAADNATGENRLGPCLDTTETRPAQDATNAERLDHNPKMDHFANSLCSTPDQLSKAVRIVQDDGSVRITWGKQIRAMTSE